VSYLIDTRIVSELARPRPNRRVLAWFAGTSDKLLHLSVLSLGELRKGIELLPAGQRKEKLCNWLEVELVGWFGPRLLPVTAAVADRWGRLVAAAGRSIPAVDSLLAATALAHDLRLVTRNSADFQFPGLVVLNPWTT
jgi:hypothetical protein